MTIKSQGKINIHICMAWQITEISILLGFFVCKSLNLLKKTNLTTNKKQ